MASRVERAEPSLLAVGKVGIHHGEGMTLGSIAENLLQSTDCNVLVANQGADETAQE